MQKFTQKYTIAHLINELPDGYEYSVDNWPLHVSLADIFAIEGNPIDLLRDLEKGLSQQPPVQTNVIGDDWYGDDKSVHVMLLDHPDELQQLHETIVKILEMYRVKFNSPQYTNEGFVPHSTVQKTEALEQGEGIIINSITLIDMFPEQNAFQRRVLGTVHFKVS